MNIKDRILALLLVAAWGFNFVVIRWGVDGVPPFFLGFLRFSAIVILAIWFIKPPKLPLKFLILYGLLGGFLQFASLFAAIKAGMPAGLASIVAQSQALFTLIFARVLIKETFNGFQLLGLIVGGIGLFCIGSLNQDHVPLWGFILTIGSAISWAFANICVRSFTNLGHVPNPTSLIIWSALVPIIPYLLCSLAFEWDQIQLTHILSFKTLLTILYLSLVSSIFAYSQWSRLLTIYPINKIAPFSLLVPVFGLLSAAIFLKETLSFWQIVGGIILIFGLLISNFGKKCVEMFLNPKISDKSDI